ncbi:MAG: hypothetical protein JWM93_2857 [Frankiales bacterium]|nr:hypothetical protein [Frankiales bacterium]
MREPTPRTFADIEDLPPGPLRRGLAYLGVTDDVPPLVRGTSAWWVRTAAFAALLLLMFGLVVVGG